MPEQATRFLRKPFEMIDLALGLSGLGCKVDTLRSFDGKQSPWQRSHATMKVKVGLQCLLM